MVFNTAHSVVALITTAGNPAVTNVAMSVTEMTATLGMIVDIAVNDPDLLLVVVK